MSNTFRTDRDGNKRKEGIHKKKATHICRCERCTGVTKNHICDKIAEKEFKKQLMTDENILKIYMQGFTDELDGTFDNSKVNLNIDGIAYNLGSLHAQVGDDTSSVDNLSDQEILKIIKKDLE